MDRQKDWSKASRKAWWRSLTAEEQLKYRCNLLEEKGIPYNQDHEWTKVLKENNYMK